MPLTRCPCTHWAAGAAVTAYQETYLVTLENNLNYAMQVALSRSPSLSLLLSLAHLLGFVYDTE